MNCMIQPHRKILAAVFILLTAYLPGRSSDAPTELSYTVCLERALSANPRLETARQARAASAARKKDASRLPNPELEFEMEDIYGSGPFDGLDERETTILVAQRLEIGGKRSARKRIGTIGIALADLNVERALQELTKLTRERFARALYEHRRVTLGREALALSNRLVDMVHQLLEAGAVPGSDYRKALLEQMNARLQLEQALADKAQSLNRLAALWDGTLPENIQLVGEGLATQDSLPAPGDYPEDTILSQILDHQLKQKEAAETLARKLRIPDITVKGGYKRFAGTDEYAFVAGISVELPVFNTGSWAVAAARSETMVASSEIQQQRISLNSRYQTVCRQFQAVEKRLDLLKNGILPTTETEMNATLEAYRAGQFSYLQVMDSMHTWIDARRKLLDAQLTRDTCQAELAYLLHSPNADFYETGAVNGDP